ncbi:hypothetical protein CPC08DRAFT_705400 [Agrocybe pediades]|nr:hypothetical protein CPC08DRAFT_705400 [Agrocybe pediades]
MPRRNTAASDSEESFTATKSKPIEGDPESEEEDGSDDGTEYEIEEVLNASRKHFPEGRMGYLVKWKGYGPEENSWVEERDAGNASALIEEFWRKNPQKKRYPAGRKSVDNKKTAKKGRTSSVQKDDSEVEDGSTTKKRSRQSTSRKPDPESEDEMDVDEPAEKPAKKARKSSTQVSSKANLRNKGTESPEIQEKPIGNMKKFEHMNNWEGLIKTIDTVEQGDEGLMVYFTLHSGEAVVEKNEKCKERFPQKLLSFYESNLRWRSVDAPETS